MPIDVKKSLINKHPYEFLANDNKKRVNWLMGGASAGKSWTTCQYLIVEKVCKEENIGLLVVRKTKPAVRASCIRLFETWLNKFGVPYHLNKSELIIYIGTNRIFFDSIDDIEKKKSIENINYVWCEEITELNERDFLRLNIGCRAENKNGINQLFGTFNPIDPVGNEWLKNRTDNPGPDEKVMVLTYLDNPFLSIAERHVIEGLANTDVEYDKIYRLGQWATPTSLIYSNWEIIKEWPKKFDEVIYGVDFGWNNPSAISEIGIKDGQFYERQLLYESGVTNLELVHRMKEMIPNKSAPVIADCAEPQRIFEIKQAGFNVHGCRKGKDSASRGIDLIKRYHVFVDYNSSNLIEELRGYKWKVNASGQILDEPLKFKDHLMDARRYAYEWLLDKIPAGIITVAGATTREQIAGTGDEFDEGWDSF